MNNKEAIEFLKNMIDREAIGFVCPKREGDVAIWQYHVEALQMAISALQAQEAKQEAKKSRCTYKPDCPWYNGSKCNSPNDHGYHECDYDRGIFPEPYREDT